MIKVSEHAYDRFKERLGLNKKAANRMAKKVYVEGIKHGDTDGKVFDYISSITHKNMIRGNEIRLYGDTVYCYVNKGDDIILCTLYRIRKDVLKSLHSKQKPPKNKGVRHV